MPRAKTQTKAKAKKPTTAELIEKAVQEQLMEALSNIEISAPEPEIDMDIVKAEIRKHVASEIAKVQPAEQNASASISRSEIKLTGKDHTYMMQSNEDGFSITEKDKAVFTANKSGAIGFGIKSPRSKGSGSGHFRVMGNSEAPLPTSGKGHTRGLIVEGDGDDANSYTLRVVSRGNKQGVNVTSGGALTMGTTTVPDNSKIYAVQTEFDEPGITIESPTKQYSDTLLKLETTSSPHKNFDYINAKGFTHRGKETGFDVFRVDGEGTVYSDKGFLSNRVGYAEIFEWEDGNHKNEDRVGLTVTLNEHSQLRIANEDDYVIGVVVEHAAVVGNAGWNTYHNRFNTQENGEPSKRPVKVVEWVDDVGVLHSHYLETLSEDFALPENAIIYESDEYGNNIELLQENAEYDSEKPYTARLKRGWTMVALVGRVKVFKGQLMNSGWMKIRELSDELEEWILK